MIPPDDAGIRCASNIQRLFSSDLDRKKTLDEDTKAGIVVVTNITRNFCFVVSENSGAFNRSDQRSCYTSVLMHLICFTQGYRNQRTGTFLSTCVQN